MSIIIFGFNRRQKPVELRCPGGRITVSRTFGGGVLVEFVSEGGQIEQLKRERDWVAAVRLHHEEREESGG